MTSLTEKGRLRWHDDDVGAHRQTRHPKLDGTSFAALLWHHTLKQGWLVSPGSSQGIITEVIIVK
jgi:hypothetical protein